MNQKVFRGALLCLMCFIFLPVCTTSAQAQIPADFGDYTLPPPEFSRPLRQNPETFPEHLSRTPVVLQSIPGLERALTQHYIQYYSTPEKKKWLNLMVQRAEPYLAFIRQEVENRNLPRELIYLPIVESEYTPTAVSRAGAAGLWQFMENSIASFDMRINEWYDERFDFWKSTVGALAKLEQNYREWNDWPLALAAYNAGLGGIRQIVSRSGTTDYWVLSAQQRLKVETIHFVPKLLAISYILSNPRGFGLANLWPETVVWERIPVPRQVDLGMLANAAGISSAELKKANGELKYSVTPPDSRYFLKVRAKDAAAVRAVFARSDISLLRYYVYTVKSGDTLSALASHYGVSVNRILEANPGTRAESLRISARLVIPAYKDVAPYTGRIINSALTSQFTGTHQVKKGETLWSIAQVYNTSPEALAEANGMHVSDILSEGRNLKTPSH